MIGRLRDGWYRAEAAMRLTTGRTAVEAGGYLWAVRSANALKSVRYLAEADPLQAEFLAGVRTDDVFLDVGANVGSWSIPAAVGRVPARKVYAIEPAPGPYGSLLENLRLNGCEDRVRALPIIAGERAGFADFRVDTLDPSTGTSHVAAVDDDVHMPAGALWAPQPVDVLIPVHSIDELVESRAIEQPTLVKIDTEGYEGPVLSGMQQTAASVRQLFVEIHPDRTADGATEASIEATVEAMGFEIVRRFPRGRQRHILCRRPQS